ncbi:MAG: hypothetical protein DI626_10560 [Micavibrio aeruginosavorus]|uniref:Uncharacterized protein n=1 Tax=Micavibrio aeruginosavorus TaxID=349221 RepID=A0A2W5BFG8_9BACT|nr:MAG: hypothetical protein DI626_10560 [Micavibrio aeruginosavorus]
MEYGYLVPLTIMVIVFGVAPGLVMKNISPSVEKLIQHYQSSQDLPLSLAKASVTKEIQND